MSGKYIDIEKEIIEKYNITLCDGSLCSDGDWSRMHAHVKSRRVCKYKFKNSIQSCFDLMHEIGHIETTKSTMRRCESEFFATVWAINLAQDTYNLEIPKSIIDVYQRYINMEWDRGNRRHGSLPKKETLNIFKFWRG